MSARAAQALTVEVECTFCGGVSVAQVPLQQAALREERLCSACLSGTAVFSARV